MTAGESGGRARRGHVSMAGLRARGWTAELVRRLLGEPDLLRANPYSASAPPTRLYGVERIEAAEQSAEFRAVAAAAVRWSIAAKAAVRRRRREVSARVAVARREAPVGFAVAQREVSARFAVARLGVPAGCAVAQRDAGDRMPDRPSGAAAQAEIQVRRPGRAADDQEVVHPPPQEPP